MTKICKPLTAVALALVGMLAVQCADTTQVAGGASDIEISAKVVSASGSPAAGAHVRLRRADYVTALPLMRKSAVIIGADAETDDSGQFEITGIKPGSYRIEVSDPSTVAGRGGAVLFACTLDVSRSLDLGIDTLRSFATIIGMTDTSGQATEQRYVQVAGMQRLVAVDASGRYSIANLPAGVFDIRAVVARAGNSEVLTRRTVQAISGDTAVVSSPMPTPWVEAAIGAEMPLGGAMYSNGIFTISGGGPDIWGYTDGFHFVYQPWIGDGEIVAQVESFDYSGDFFSKAGVQFRSSLDPAAANVCVSLVRDSLNHYLASMHCRRVTGRLSVVTDIVDPVPAPAWVRLVRTGDIFIGQASLDGIVWRTVGADTVTMGANVLVGIAVTSHVSTRLARASFDSVAVR